MGPVEHFDLTADDTDDDDLPPHNFSENPVFDQGTNETLAPKPFQELGGAQGGVNPPCNSEPPANLSDKAASSKVEGPSSPPARAAGANAVPRRGKKGHSRGLAKRPTLAMR